MHTFANDRGTPEPVSLAAHRVIEQVRDHAMFLLDRHGRATSWNEGVMAILGWPEADWIGQPARVAFTPEDVASGVPERELAQAADTGRADDDRWMARRNGERFFAVGAVTRILDDGGELLGFLKVLRDFTAQRQVVEECERLLVAERVAREEAEQQAATLDAAIDAMPDGVFFGTAERLTRCNAAALSLLGVPTLAALQGWQGAPGELLRMRQQPDGPPLPIEDLPFTRALRGQTSMLEGWATRSGGGEAMRIRSSAAPIRVDGRVLGAVTVITDLAGQQRLQHTQDALSRAETVLRERDEELRALTSGVRDYAIFTVDPKGCISSWHEGARLMKGYTAEEAIGMPFAQLFLPEQRAAGQPERELAAAAREGEFKGEGQRLRKNGEVFDAAVVLTALRGPQGELLGYLKLTQDITERKRGEREREEALRNAEAARAEAERANQSKNEFLATISHELRTPLSAILGWAQVLERGISGAEGLKQGLSAITRNARVQVQLIEDLLDMNRIESGQLRLDMQPTELTGAIASAIESVLPAATARQITLRTLLDPAAGTVLGDSARLQQIVWNLLSNAVKFTPAGGAVTVLLERQGHTVSLSVADTGQGIAAEFLPRVFDRFQQQDGGTTRRHGGLGIGLAIVRQLAHLHGGSVEAASGGAGQGATFTLRLPSLSFGMAVLPQDAAAPAAQASPSLQGVTVLLVDDEADGRTMAEHVLRAAGAEVLPASSAQQAFELLREQRPRVIVSDIGMPVHDGYDLMRWVRGLQPAEGGRTVAAALTAFAGPEDRRRALAAGYQMHLVKPLEPEALVAAVASLAAL